MKLAFATFTYIKYNVGRIIRETGLALDRAGSRLTRDIGYLEPSSRHRSIFPLYDKVPFLQENTFLAENASVIGDVTMGSDSVVSYGATIRGDFAAVRVGKRTVVGDLSVIKTAHSLPGGVPNSVNIGNNVNIGSNCTLISCVVDDLTTIGPKTIVSEGCLIERGVVIGANSYVPPGKLIPAGQFWEGSPVHFVRDLTPAEINLLEQTTSELQNLASLQSLKIKSLE